MSADKPKAKISKESIDRLIVLGRALANNDTATISKFKDGLIGGAESIVQARKRVRERIEKEERSKHRKRSRG